MTPRHLRAAIVVDVLPKLFKQGKGVVAPRPVGPLRMLAAALAAL